MEWANALAESGINRNQSSGSKISNSAKASFPILSSNRSTLAYNGISLHACTTCWAKVISVFEASYNSTVPP